MIGPIPLCLDCRHFLDAPNKGGFICEAFSDGIPKRILVREVDHREPYEGDNGIQFEPIAQEPA